jgi:lysozyme
MNARGIDISHWQNVTDWPALYSSGLRFVGLKATQGATGLDSKFREYRAAARTQPFLLRVFYAFLMPVVSGADQAKHLLDVVGPLLPNERLCVDLEHRGGDGRLDVTLAQVDAFVGELLGGACADRRPLLYTSRNIWRELGDPAWALASEVDLWMKRYARAPGEVPPPWAARGWTVWQRSENGTAPGIAGPVDIDEFAGDEAALAAYAKLGGAVTRTVVG